jgi:hypothetical protein
MANESDASKVIEYEGGRITVLAETKKAKPIVADVPEGQNDEQPQWTKMGVLEPLIPPDSSLKIYRESGELSKQCDAAAHNTSGFGWDLEEVIKLDDPKAAQKARATMYLLRVREYRKAVEVAVANGDDIKSVPIPEEPTPEEVKDQLAVWRRRARLERAELEIFFKSFCYESHFGALLKQTDVNVGISGYCGWEVIRGADMRPIRGKLKEPDDLRHSQLDINPVPTRHLRPTSDISYEVITVERRFRRYVVRNATGGMVWYKQFGDPRVMSNITGHYYDDMNQFLKAMKDGHETEIAKPATEILLFNKYSPKSNGYGLPPWHGDAPVFQSARLAWEHIFDDIANGKMPRGILAATDTALDGDVVEGLKRFFNESGPHARNRVAMLECSTSGQAKVSGGSTHANIEFIDLSSSQKAEEFRSLLEAEAEKAAEAFGNPPILIGRTKDMQNRSVAEVSAQLYEDQRSIPARQDWEWIINTNFVQPMGFVFWKFKLKGPRRFNVKESGKALSDFVERGILSPAEARPIAYAIMGAELTGDPQWWQKVSQKMVLAGMKPEEPEPEDVNQDGVPDEEQQVDIADDQAEQIFQRSWQLAAGADAMQKRLQVRRTSPESDDFPSVEDLEPEDG